MNDSSDTEKGKEVNSDANGDAAKKKPDLDDTLSRLLRRKGDEDNDASNDQDAAD